MGRCQSRLFRSVLHLVIIGLFRLWISRSVYSNPPTRLYHRRRVNPDYWRMVTGIDWIVQHCRIVFVRLVRTGLSKTKTPLWHLPDTRNCHYAIYRGPTNGHERSVLFSSDGDFVAIHRTADHRINRADPRIAVSLNLGGSCVF